MSEVKQVTIGGVPITIKDETARTTANAKYTKPAGGIPKTDLTTAVQTSLGKADTAVQDVTGKADKVSGATNGNIAALNSNGNLKDGGVPADKVARNDGYYQEMTSGLAENLIDTKGQGTEQVFTDRTSCGDVSISDDGVALFQKLHGNSLAWNQLVQNGDFANGTTGYAISSGNGTMAVTSGKLVITKTAISAIALVKASHQVITLIAGHKYLISVRGFADSQINCTIQLGASNFASLGNLGTTQTSLCLIKEATDGGIVWYLDSDSALAADSTISLTSLSIIDLTLMFGAGKEPSTVAEFEQYYHDAYYAYCAGTIINNMVQKYVTTGFNQFDESTFESGKWMWNGQIITGSEYATRRASSTYFPCFPSTKYYAYCNTDNVNGVVIAFYDADKTFISQTATGNAEITSPANARFFRVASVSPTAEVNINLSWSGYRNGEYEPYWQRKMSVDMTKLYGKLNGAGDMVQIFPNGMDGIGSLCDKVFINSGVSTAQRVFGYYKFTGNETWEDMGNYARVQRSVLGGEYSAGQNATSAMTSNGLTPVLTGVGTTVMSCSFGADYFNVNINGTGSAVASAMAGVEVIWQMTSKDYTDVQMSDDGGATFYDIPSAQKVADFGTESIEPTGVDANGVPLTAPLRAVIKYNDDFVRTIVNLPKNYMSKESIDGLTALLGALHNGTISRSWDDTNQKYTWSFTANGGGE